MMIIFGGANMYIGMRLLGDQGNETRVRSCQHTRLLRTRHSVWAAVQAQIRRVLNLKPADAKDATVAPTTR